MEVWREVDVPIYVINDFKQSGRKKSETTFLKF